MVIDENGIEISVEVEKSVDWGSRWEIERVRLNYHTLFQIYQALEDIKKDHSE